MQIVSAYYKIPSKKPHEFYMEQMERFFAFMRKPILFFTEEALIEDLNKISGPNVEFAVQPFNELDVFTEYPPKFWKEQRRRDTEEYHTWQLGALWANKKHFLDRASEIKTDTDWFVWVDAGCVRLPHWAPIMREFTDRNRFQEPGIYMQLLKPPKPEENFFRAPAVHIAGAIIVAHRSFIKRYIEEYNATLDCYDSLKIPAIMDQYIMASIKQPWVHKVEIPSDQIFPDDWFFFLAYI
jgi:hypothetical protein